ncbi:MAG: hypothetical protein J5643_10745 [Lachnospiraceae bacterium]|nr:hypothetical protein [Lachnospiraceae bacterium]
MKKRKNRGEANIIVVVLVVVAIVGLAAFLAIHYVKSQYEEGTYERGRYVNKWAKVQVELPDDFSKYQETSNSSGMMRTFRNKAQTCLIGICTIKGNLSVQDGFDDIKKEISTGSVGIFGRLYNANITYYATTTATIAGKKYECLPIEVQIGSTRTYYYYYARKINRNGIMLFLTGGTTKEEADHALSLISKYK